MPWNGGRPTAERTPGTAGLPPSLTGSPRSGWCNVQIGLSKLPEIGDVPLFLDLLKNPADRQVAEFLSAAIALGRTIFAPPDVPAERIAALRRAFDATMTDPAYLEECKTRNLSTGGPMTGEQMEALMLRMFGSPPELTERAKATVTPK